MRETHGASPVEYDFDTISKRVRETAYPMGTKDVKLTLEDERTNVRQEHSRRGHAALAAHAALVPDLE